MPKCCEVTTWTKLLDPCDIEQPTNQVRIGRAADLTSLHGSMHGGSHIISHLILGSAVDVFTGRQWTRKGDASGRRLQESPTGDSIGDTSLYLYLCRPEEVQDNGTNAQHQGGTYISSVSEYLAVPCCHAAFTCAPRLYPPGTGQREELSSSRPACARACARACCSTDRCTSVFVPISLEA